MHGLIRGIAVECVVENLEQSIDLTIFVVDLGFGDLRELAGSELSFNTGPLRCIWTVCGRVLSVLCDTCMEAGWPSGRDFGAHARHCVGLRSLLCRHHGCELEIPLCPTYRFLSHDHSVFDCGCMALVEVGSPFPCNSTKSGRQSDCTIRWTAPEPPINHTRTLPDQQPL